MWPGNLMGRASLGSGEMTQYSPVGALSVAHTDKGYCSLHVCIMHQKVDKVSG